MATTRAESRVRYFVRNIAKNKGWNISHPDKGGDFLEEQEIISYFPDCGLGLNRPDFLVCLSGSPMIIIETKNDYKKYNLAIDEAVEYANLINKTGRYTIKFAIGVAGDDERGFVVKVRFQKDNVWEDLKSKDFVVTALLSKDECRKALEADNYTMQVDIPSSAAFVNAAIELSNVLRKAKVEPPLRPKVIGSVTAALYYGNIDYSNDGYLEQINSLSSKAVTDCPNFDLDKKNKLIESIKLSGSDYDRLNPYILRIVSILQQLNVKAVLQSDADFLGMFYEAFLRYGYDNNAMGIVFTPRHITRFCADLVGVEIGHKVIDITCGTGGFLVAAFDKMKKSCTSEEIMNLIKESIYGYDTNPTVWALACLNMFFRGDGKSHIDNTSSLFEESRRTVKRTCNRAFLNPPFHQEGEPEHDFIDASMDSLIQGGLFAGVVYAGVFADSDNKIWRENFLSRHTLLAMISLPDDLFYLAASAPTTIIIAKAHVPQDMSKDVFMAKIWNDGYEKLKGKRVECAGSQMEMILENFKCYMQQRPFMKTPMCTTIPANLLAGGNEFSPQQWLPTLKMTEEDLKKQYYYILQSMFVAVAHYQDITESITDSSLARMNVGKNKFPLSKKEKLSYFFYVKTGHSQGVKNYSQGICPYVSSGEGENGIVGLVNTQNDEICEGCISVSAFGNAYLQPWNFMARGNGGSSVRILIPKFQMSVRELFWFIAQINYQSWRFPYARMAIKERLEKLEIESPDQYMPQPLDIVEKLMKLKRSISELSQI